MRTPSTLAQRSATSTAVWPEVMLPRRYSEVCILFFPDNSSVRRKILNWSISPLSLLFWEAQVNGLPLFLFSLFGRKLCRLTDQTGTQTIHSFDRVFLPNSFFSRRIPLSTCFSCSRNGGRKRSTVSWVLLKSTPWASACSTRGRAGISS